MNVFHTGLCPDKPHCGAILRRDDRAWGATTLRWYIRSTQYGTPEYPYSQTTVCPACVELMDLAVLAELNV